MHNSGSGAQKSVIGHRISVKCHPSTAICQLIFPYLAPKFIQVQTILLFGAGKSATVLIDYLIAEAPANDWWVVVADASREQVLAKTNGADRTEAVQLDIQQAEERNRLVQRADLVISLMPPALHHLVAQDCIAFGKHLLTASYVDAVLKELAPEIAAKGLLFLCEMGLDPGIDHLSAMQLIDGIRDEGGNITSFKSHCGGLVAPESDDNPWHYKISWNPRNVVMAGKAGAVYKENGQTVSLSYQQLFSGLQTCFINTELGSLGYYPNRDSLSYIPLYGLEDAHTFLRTTLRYPGFLTGWQQIVALGLTDETASFESTGKTLQDFYQQHFAQAGFRLSDADEGVRQQLLFLGADDANTLINKGLCSTADVLQLSLEHKLALGPTDKDMIVMKHEIEFEKEGRSFITNSVMVAKGTDSLRTAMAKTVGLPLGIAAKLILNGTIGARGLLIPISKEIYSAVLPELAKHGIGFRETTAAL
jgi:saccharopine dehydrogenase-like NADP-dependent oxidoreductase